VLATEAIRDENGRDDIEPIVSATANRLALGVLRHRRLLDALLARLVARRLPGKDLRLLDLLRLGLYELLYMDAIPSYATVDSYVELIRRIKGPKVAGFANALYRKACAWKPEEIKESMAAEPPAVRLSVPDWLAERAFETFGHAWPEEMARLNEPADISVRANPRRTAVSTLADQLREAGLHPTAVAWLPGALRLPPDEPPYRSLQFARGCFWPQDAASQFVVSLLPLPPARSGPILDACAGTGTKSLFLATRQAAEDRVVALDLKAGRVVALGRRAEKLGIDNVDGVVGDLLSPPFPPGLFSLVLVDAPCSGLGTLRRHPELKWRRQPRDVADNAARQRLLLASAARLVAAGGYLAYAVCTFTLDEGPYVVEEFLAANPDFSLADPRAWIDREAGHRLDEVRTGTPYPWMRDEFLFTTPTQFEADCFFAAVLRRG
jgi:16S rRNA (cytosine967-C5)-methyltransferase